MLTCRPDHPAIIEQAQPLETVIRTTVMLRQVVPGTIRRRRRDDRPTEKCPRPPGLGGAARRHPFQEEIHS